MAMVSMGDTWDRAVAFVGEHLSTILPIALLAILLPASVAGSFAGTQADAGPALAATIGVVSIILSIVQIWGQLAITALAVDPALGGAARGVAARRLLPTIGVYVLIGLAGLVLVLPLVAILMTSGVTIDQLRAGSAGAISPATVGVLALYVLVLLVVGLFLAARLAMLLPVLVAERRGAGSIGRSFSLTRGLTFKLVGVILLYAIVVSVATLAVQSVFGIGLRFATGEDAGFGVASVVTAVAVAAVSTGFTVVASAFLGKLYAAITGRQAAVAFGDDTPPPVR